MGNRVTVAVQDRNRSFRTLSQQQSHSVSHMLLITIETLRYERHCLRKALEAPLIHKAKTIGSLGIKKRTIFIM